MNFEEFKDKTPSEVSSLAARNGLRIVVLTSSRTITNETIFNWCLDNFHSKVAVGLLIHGKAIGGDRLGDSWAASRRIPAAGFEPDYQAFPANVRRWKAPKARNSEMVNIAHAACAVWDGESRGTIDAYEKALKRQIPTAIYNLRTKKILWQYLENLK